MSGGYIKRQADGGHQVVIFTFKGKIDQSLADQWNQDILALKQLFNANPADEHLAGVTMRGDPTPSFAKRGKKR